MRWPNPTTVTHDDQRPGVTFVALASAVTAQRVRWHVTQLVPERHDCLGGAEITFYAAAEPESLPRGIKTEAAASPVLERRGGVLVQPLRVTLDYSYGFPVEAVVRVEGLELKPVRLPLGTPAFDAGMPEVQSEKRLETAV